MVGPARAPGANAPPLSRGARRKLSGAYLACMKLRARVPARRLFYEAFDGHAFGADSADAAGVDDFAAATA